MMKSNLLPVGKTSFHFRFDERKLKIIRRCEKKITLTMQNRLMMFGVELSLTKIPKKYV
jgi:hypothetical protein